MRCLASLTPAWLSGSLINSLANSPALILFSDILPGFCSPGWTLTDAGERKEMVGVGGVVGRGWVGLQPYSTAEETKAGIA